LTRRQYILHQLYI